MFFKTIQRLIARSHMWTWRNSAYFWTKFLNPARFKAQVSGFDRVTGLTRSIPIFLKIQNGVILVKIKNKKQKSTGCNQVLLGQPGHRVNPPGHPGHTGSWLFLFFHKPGSVPAPDRLGPESTRQAEPVFKTMLSNYIFKDSNLRSVA